MMNHYDIVIVGSGIAGSSLALVLSRIHCKVLVIERGKHPRFAIGESTVPTTTLGFSRLAKQYKIPELAHVCHYSSLKQHNLVGYPKRHFWYGLHHKGQELQAHEQMVFETFPFPIGPDVHILRADADAYLVDQLAKYGVDYVDQTILQEFSYDGQTASLLLQTPQGEQKIKAKYVVDASGHASFFANLYGLRDQPARLHTNARSIFGHFRKTGDIEKVLPAAPFRYRRDAGTMHHCFYGGWAWVIPFDNEITSIGFMLDIDKYPFDPNIPVQEEIDKILADYPSIAAHLKDIEPVFPIIRTGRVQFSSKTILGEGFILTPHAAAFVDALFSNGLILTQSFIERFVPIIQKALQTNDFSLENFRAMEKAFFAEIETVDLAVNGMYKAFRHYDIMKQYWRTWVHGTTLQYITRIVGQPHRPDSCALTYGASLASWRQTLEEMHNTVTNEQEPPLETAAKLQEIMDKIPHPYRNSCYPLNKPEVCNIHTDIDKKYQVNFFVQLLDQPEIQNDGGNRRRLYKFLLKAIGKKLWFRCRYRLSKWLGTHFHRSVDMIYALTNK